MSTTRPTTINATEAAERLNVGVYTLGRVLRADAAEKLRLAADALEGKGTHDDHGSYVTGKYDSLVPEFYEESEKALAAAQACAAAGESSGYCITQRRGAV